MAAKVQLPQDNTGSSVLSQMPPSVSLASSILASTISLPESPLIVYHVFACPPATPDSLDHLDLARRKVLHTNKGKTFLDSLSPIVHVTRDVCALYVFALGSNQRTCDAHDTLARLELEDLICECSLSHATHFPPRYPQRICFMRV